jgi:predicted aconitase
MRLNSDERAMLAGDAGAGAQLAMKMVTSVGEAEGAARLIEIDSAHIDGCLYHGQSGIDFAKALLDGGAGVNVPTTLNVAAIDMLHPELFRGDASQAAKAKELADVYVRLGCQQTWTCAPYQLSVRPEPGQQIAWGESNAIVFANSVLGARTNRYGDFLDICCAVTGKAPYSGLHTDDGRLATVEVVLKVPDNVLDTEMLYPVLGYLLGKSLRSEVPVIVGLDERADEDRLKALGAAAASSGALAMFHAAGLTPEAPDREAALGGRSPSRTLQIGLTELDRARSELTTMAETLGAVSVGTPHMSIEELRRLAELAEGRMSRVPFYVNTSRSVLERATTEGLTETLGGFGATIVTDTCTYITPIIEDVAGSVMTNSAKWAHYAPANLGVDVVFSSLIDCVESSVAGEIVNGGAWL